MDPKLPNPVGEPELDGAGDLEDEDLEEDDDAGDYDLEDEDLEEDDDDDN